MRTIEIFTAPDCSYCTAAMDLLESRGLAFVERNVSDPQVLAEFRRRLPRQKSLPQIFFGAEHIGGYDDLALRLEASG